MLGLKLNHVSKRGPWRLYYHDCHVIGQWRSVGDCILGVCFWLQKVWNFLEFGRQPIGDWSAISQWLKTVAWLSATAATGRRSVPNQSATCRRPPKTFLRSIWSQIAEMFHLLQPKPPCDQIVPATFCNRSRTSRRPPCNRSQPPCDQPKIWSQGRRPVASYVWPGLNWWKVYINSQLR